MPNPATTVFDSIACGSNGGVACVKSSSSDTDLPNISKKANATLLTILLWNSHGLRRTCSLYRRVALFAFATLVFQAGVDFGSQWIARNICFKELYALRELLQAFYIAFSVDSRVHR